ncbi:MFS transporter [Snodgrassella alvi]|uniref:MFS transporter n=1 Tax=Snodgrassella alvi TaxID=1196083 RepID=UPI0009985C4E|nr:MFS transporter [Snodgrassella alvi]OOX80064.1 MFS transporter [Snodgrassella alvi]ORF02663.1 MFS transporter [Snodgrassella alvi]
MKSRNADVAAEQKLLTREDVRTLMLSSFGGALEFYDFVIYVFYAKVLSELFFPAGLNPFWALLNTYGIFAAGYLFRPLGGIVMAHFGDLFGRKRLFALSIMMMALPTLCLGLLPTFATIGYAAPILLLVLRMIQGVAIGGEIPAAWTFVSEHVPEKRIGMANGFLTGGLSLGILLGSLIALGMAKHFSSEAILNGAWRIPFIIGGLFGLLTLYLRSYLHETPVFKAMQQRKELTTEMPVKVLVSKHKIAVSLGMLLTWFLTGCIVVILLAMPQLLTGSFGFSSTQAFEMQSMAIVMQMLGCVIYGLLADRLGIGRVLIGGIVFTGVMTALFYPALGKFSDSLIFVLYLLLGLAAGVAGIVSAAMIRMFPPAIRFTGISFSYNVAYAIVGGLTLPLVQWLSLLSQIGAMYYILYLCGIGILAAVEFQSRYR